MASRETIEYLLKVIIIALMMFTYIPIILLIINPMMWVMSFVYIIFAFEGFSSPLDFIFWVIDIALLVMIFFASLKTIKSRISEPSFMIFASVALFSSFGYSLMTDPVLKELLSNPSNVTVNTMESDILSSLTLLSFVEIFISTKILPLLLWVAVLILYSVINYDRFLGWKIAEKPQE